jgi:aspartyl protease family protein
VSNVLRMTGLSLLAAVSSFGAAQAVLAFDPARQGLAMPLRLPHVGFERDGSPAAPAIRKARDGHFWAEGRVNGAPVRFLVDTGASAVALTAADARRLGLEPSQLTYGHQVDTANGPARAAAVTLDAVSVGGATLTDVDALVIEHGLDASLLGMSYLGRLSRIEATPTALVLRP